MLPSACNRLPPCPLQRWRRTRRRPASHPVLRQHPREGARRAFCWWGSVSHRGELSGSFAIWQIGCGTTRDGRVLPRRSRRVGRGAGRIGHPCDRPRAPPGFPPRDWRADRRIAARHRADIIHCHHYSPFVYGCIATVLRPARLLFTEHGRLADAPPSRKRYIANQALRLRADRVFTVSADLKAHLVREGFRPDRVEVLYNGIDIGPAPGASDRERRGARWGSRATRTWR